MVYTCKLAVYTQAKTVLTFQIIGIVQGGFVNVVELTSARASAIEVYTCKPVVYTQAKTVLTFQIIGIVQGRLHM